MAILEREYIIPLRREWLKVPRYRRSKKAIKAIREFSRRHMKVDTVKIGKYLNMKILERGRKSPPHKVKVKMIKDEDKNKKQFVTVELPDAPVKVESKEKKKTVVEKVKETIKPEVKEAEIVEERVDEKKEKKEVLEHAKLEKKTPYLKSSKMLKKQQSKGRHQMFIGEKK